MGVFSRLRDIINSNINSMLEKAEDPEKLIKLMIQEMEDTLVEIKASCAGAMAQTKKTRRALAETRRRVAEWEDRVTLAVQKERDDLAREALVQKRSLLLHADGLQCEADGGAELEAKYKRDIEQLEAKLQAAREKHRILVLRHAQAGHSRRAREAIRKVDHNDAFVRFESFENRIERKEAEAHLVNYGRSPVLESQFTALESDEGIEKELADVKQRVAAKRTESE